METVKYLFIFSVVISNCLAAESPEKDWFIQSIGTSSQLTIRDKQPGVVIAIVDDGFNTTHEALHRFIWNNPGEIPDNKVDDDGNGYVDDVNGWDVSDNDNQLKPHPSRLIQYYHGTHLAGVITRILSTMLGENAADHFRILPVKAISDVAPNTYLKEGYRGIDYAIDMGADIILTAWSVAAISREEKNILQKAEDQGILVIAAAGNLSTEQPQYPAAEESVLAIAALNKLDQKLPVSSYGQSVDLAAPGEDIYSADSISDVDYRYRSGSSFAAAMAAAAAAAVRLANPDFSSSDIKICLKDSAAHLRNISSRYRGKLGFGKLNIASSVACEILNESSSSNEILSRTKGFLRARQSRKWTISPGGRFEGLRFNLFSKQGEAGDARIVFFVDDGSGLREIKGFDLDALPGSVYLPHIPVQVELEAENAGSDLDYLFEYHVETIDFTREYCRDTVYLYKEGAISDGSGEHDYAFHSSCKWLITAPEGKVIRFEFSELDTEARVDKVLFFDGEGTHEPIMASISGPEIPPVFTTWNNQVLIWFVSDGQNQAAGWKVNYSFQEK